MRDKFVGVILWLLVSAQSVGFSETLRLVHDGKTESAIVVAQEPTPSAQLAAQELQRWLAKISGAKVPILPEGKVPRSTYPTLILVGDTKATAKLELQSDDFELEELRIRTFPNTLILIGDDERPNGLRLNGTLWAVELFAEQHLGVRILWPGELGEVAPKKKSIEIGDIDFRFVPKLRRRGIRNIGYGDRIQRSLDKLGWKAEDFKRHHKQAESWFRFHRLGGSFRGSYGHAYGDYWERFSQEHPEWFAQQPDGTRDNSKAQDGRRARLCVSNRQLMEQVARDRIEQMLRRPTYDTISISPNDGGRATFCLCKNCEALDAPEGEMIEMWGPNGPIEHVSLTDRFVKFYSGIAEIVSQQYPDRYLGAYAYSAYQIPPIRAKLHPNVVIGFVGFGYLNEQERQKARESWLSWSKAANKLFLRPNLLMAGLGYPTVYVHKLAEDLRYCDEHGMFLTDFDCCYQNWASDGLNYYVLAKLLWDRDTNVDAIIADYCRAGFGPAAQAVEKYFRYIETKTDELARSNAYVHRRKSQEVLAKHYDREYLTKCNALLDEAKRKAGGNEWLQKRIAFLRKPLEYARIRRDYTLAQAAARQGDRQARKRMQELETEREQFYQNLGISWELNASCLKFYGY